MRINIATDHAGFELKEFLMSELTKIGHIVKDHGAFSYDPEDDYPQFCIDCANAVIKENRQNDGTKEYTSLGIVIGGSGNGEQITANKVKGIRAALCWNEDTAKFAREHNNANIISIGARMHTNEEALKIVNIFINTKWSEEERHSRRIRQIIDYEKEK